MGLRGGNRHLELGKALEAGQIVIFRGAPQERGIVISNDGVTVRIQYRNGVAPWSVYDAGMDVSPVTT